VFPSRPRSLNTSVYSVCLTTIVFPSHAFRNCSRELSAAAAGTVDAIAMLKTAHRAYVTRYLRKSNFFSAGQTPDWRALAISGATFAPVTSRTVDPDGGFSL